MDKIRQGQDVQDKPSLRSGQDVQDRENRKQGQDRQDRPPYGGRQDLQDRIDGEKNLPYSHLTDLILKSCFEVIQELGSGFLESVYKNSLGISLQEKGLSIEIEKPFEVLFKNQKVGFFLADLVIENTVIIELKCAKFLLPELLAQTINYLKAADIPIGLLVNFGQRKLEYKRLFHPKYQ